MLSAFFCRIATKPVRFFRRVRVLNGVVLEHGERPELVGLSFEISPRTSLEEAQAVLGKVRRTRANQERSHPLFGTCSRTERSEWHRDRIIQLNRVHRNRCQGARHQCLQAWPCRLLPAYDRRHHRLLCEQTRISKIRLARRPRDVSPMFSDHHTINFSRARRSSRISPLK